MTNALLPMQIYLLNALLGTGMLVFLYIRNICTVSNAQFQRHFVRRLFYASLSGFAECAYAILKLCGVTNANVYNVVGAVFFTACAVHCYRCFRFDRRYVRFDAPLASNAMRFVSKIPAAIAVALVILSSFNGFVYHFEEDVLVYGEGFWLFFALSYGYLIYSMFSTFRRYYRNNFISSRRFRQLLLIESVNLVLFLLKRIVMDVPLALIGMMLTSMLLHTLIVDTTIVYDALTKVLSKESVNASIERRLHRDAPFYITIMDIDRFKHINDTFGHNEGDRVLKSLGSALNDICRKHDATPGRIGGDEFCIMSEEEPTHILADLQERIDSINADETRYVLSVSAGTYCRSASEDSVNAIIEKADAEMYRIKNAKKAQTAEA